MVLALVVRLIPDLDRRRELLAELYEVPRWEQPYWVAQQFEVAIRIGLFPQVSWYWGRHVWHRCTLESGMESHRKYPDSFEVPTAEEKAKLIPGDFVKLMWSVKRHPGERMWVRITDRHGDRPVGTLESWPIYVFMDPGETVKFHIDEIIDCQYVDERDAEQVASYRSGVSGGRELAT